MDTKVFEDLHSTLKKSSDEAKASEPLFTRNTKKLQKTLEEYLGKATNAAEVVAQKAKLNFRILDKKEKDLKIDNNLTVQSVVNWMGDLFKDVIDQVNNQGDILAFIVKQLGHVTESDASKEELKKKQDDLEKLVDDIEKKDEAAQNKLNQKQADLEKKTNDIEESFEKKYEALDKKYEKKCEALDMKCDEVRQRGLKGNLIISSPARTTARGHDIPSLAKHEYFWDRFGIWRSETDTEMVCRLVERKTGVCFQEREIVACHPLGRRERNTFILSISNRTPMSSWEVLTRGMMSADNNFTNENVFINFQLTKRRGEICKEVRRAKKEELIKGYDMDANGRIFVRDLDNSVNEIVTHQDATKYFPS